MPIRLFVSTAMNTPRAMELRRLIRLMGRYHDRLFGFYFIEDMASVQSPDDEMREHVRASDAVVMVLYAEEGQPPLRPGVAKEYKFARDYSKPVLLFVERGFKEMHGDALVKMWEERKMTSAEFLDNEHLVQTLETSIYRELRNAFISRASHTGQQAAPFRTPEGEKQAGEG